MLRELLRVTGPLRGAFPILVVFFLLRALFIALFFLSPILIAVIVTWAVYTHSKGEAAEESQSSNLKGEGDNNPG